MSQKLDVKFIQPFIDGTVETLKIQCQTTIETGKPYLKSKSADAAQVDIAGIIGITSQTFNGSISVCFPEKTFLGLMSRMLGENYTTLTKDLEDGAGELVNIVFGYAKRVLNEKGYTLQKALPSVIVGHGVSVKTLSDSPTAVLPFKTDVGPFQIEIAMEADSVRQAG